MKQLVQIDPETYERQAVICTFALEDERVVVSPAEALEMRPHLAKLAYGGEILTPEDGAAYYDVLEKAVRGSYFFVEKVPSEE
jgi:hypothetical protein